MFTNFCFFIASVVIFIESFTEGQAELLGVAMVYRHGDRTPLKTYPTDPYANISYWPVGFGQLTNLGKFQEYELGEWFRNRYAHFISDQYSKNDVYVLSTDIDRTLMSAQVVLAGLFPPKDKQVWNANLDWQPIPVHTIPEVQDNILRMKMPCDKYAYLYSQLLKSQTFQDIDMRNHELYEYLSNHSGKEVININGVQQLYSTLTIERTFNLTLPEWTDSVYPDKMASWSHLSFALHCYTPELARFRSGPLLNHIYSNFLKVRKNKGYKLIQYSAHDSTIANTLMALKVFEYHSPPFASTILFELHNLNNTYFINILYKNSSIPQKIILSGCEFFCRMDKFKKIITPLLITPLQWKQECILSRSIWSHAAFSATTFFLLLVVCLLGVFCTLVVCIRNRKNRRGYTVLPD